MQENCLTIPTPLNDYIGRVDRNQFLEDVAEMSKPVWAKHYLGVTVGKFHEEAWELMDEVPNCLILDPAAHGKTDTYTILYNLILICQNRYHRIGIYGFSATNAEVWLNVIADRLVGNRKIIAKYGEFRPKIRQRDDERWNDTQLTVKLQGRDLKDPTVTARGYGAGVLGKRHTRASLDDVVMYNKNCLTPEALDNQIRWLSEVIVPMVEDAPAQPYVPAKDGLPAIEASPAIQGQVCLIGTAQADGDMYDYVENELKWPTIKRKALIDEEKKIVLWPEIRSFDYLMDKKASMTPGAFARRYQNEIMDPSDADIPPYLVDRAIKAGKDMTCISAYNSDNFAVELRRIIGIDPAVGLSKKAKYFVLQVWGFNEDKMILLNMTRKKIPANRQGKLILSKITKFSPEVLKVENNATQTYLEAIIKTLVGDDLSIDTKISGCMTGKEKADPDKGVTSLSVLFEQGKVILPSGDNYSRKMIEPLVNELKHYPNTTTTDAIMTMWFVYMEIRKRLRRQKSEEDGETKQQGNLYKQGGWRRACNR